MQSFVSFRNISLGGVHFIKQRNGDMEAKELVERCRRGERQAMGLLYTTYAQKLEQVGRKYLKNEADVQDVVHDSFVVILTSMDRLKDAQKLESWMCTIVRNLALKQTQQPVLEDVAKTEVEDADSEVEIFDYDKLMAIVEQLPDGYRKVLKLSVLQGLSHKEIGEILGIAPHSSSSQLARAKEMVRRNAKRCGILLLAFMALVAQLFVPEEEEQTQEQVAETGKPNKIIRETIAKNSTPQPPLNVPSISIVSNIPNTSIVSNASKTIKNTEIIETPEKPTSQFTDSITEQSTDTTRQEPCRVPDLRTNDRQIADNRVITSESNLNVNNKESRTWHLSVSFVTGSESNLLALNTNSSNINTNSWADPLPPDYDTSILKPDTLTNTRTHHYIPLTFGISICKSLSPRWSVEAGLRYTLLRSEIATTISLSNNSITPTTETMEQKLHYLGIPLKLSYSLWSSPSYLFYTTGGIAADIPVGSTNPVLWSMNLGTGFQYKITPSISLYAEPNLNYYFNSTSGMPTIHTARPLEFTIPIGLRFSW